MPKFEFVPSGRLALRLEGPLWEDYALVDQPNRPIETRLNEFFIAAVRVALKVAQHRRDMEARQLAREREEEARRVREELERQERARVAALEKEADAHDRACRIRAYVAARMSAGAASSEPPSDELDAWKRWALNVAYELDPCVDTETVPMKENS